MPASDFKLLVSRDFIDTEQIHNFQTVFRSFKMVQLSCVQRAHAFEFTVRSNNSWTDSSDLFKCVDMLSTIRRIDPTFFCALRQCGGHLSSSWIRHDICWNIKTSWQLLILVLDYIRRVEAFNHLDNLGTWWDVQVTIRIILRIPKPWVSFATEKNEGDRNPRCDDDRLFGCYHRKLNYWLSRVSHVENLKN